MPVVRVTLMTGEVQSLGNMEIAQKFIDGREVEKIEIIDDEQLQQELDGRIKKLHAYQDSIGLRR